MAKDTIPVIEFSLFSKEPDVIAREMTAACKDWGFFYVKHHGVPQESIDAMFELVSVNKTGLWSRF